MAMRGVFAKADVGDYEERGEASAKKANSLYDGTLRVVGFGTERVFCVGGDRDTEKYDGTKAFADKRVEEGNEFLDAAPALVWKGRDEGFLFILIGYKKREYKH